MTKSTKTKAQYQAAYNQVSTATVSSAKSDAVGSKIPPALSPLASLKAAPLPFHADVKPEAVPTGKTAVLIAMLGSADGASLDQMVAATGWQKHSIRGFISGTLKKKLGLDVVSEKMDTGRIYRIASPAAEATDVN